MSADQPISAEAFAAALDPISGGPSDAVTLAVSGGPDSIALAVLAKVWAQARQRDLHALVVNHNLRPEAGQEAETVTKTLRDFGVPATALHYDGPIPNRDIQAAARQIRYGLMADWMLSQGRSVLLLAHHLDDQAETVLLRLARGSGVDGLSAIAPVSERDGMTLVRPLLAFPKAQLLATAEASGLPIIQDPTNRNEAHARVRMRGLAGALAAEGASPQRLADTARRMARARDALDQARDAYFSDHVTAHPAGFAVFDKHSFVTLPEEIGLRVVSHMIRVLGGRVYPPRAVRLEALWEALSSDADGGGAGRTLAGCRILPWQGKTLICREAQGVASPLKASNTGQVWDNRYRFRLEGVDAPQSSLGRLGQEGVSEVRKICTDAQRRVLEALPGAVRAGLPALREKGALVAIPHIGWHSTEWAQEGEIAFRATSKAWGDDFQQTLPFSKPASAPI